jgi:hypothetical protein
MKSYKFLISEILWLTSCLLITVAICFSMFGKSIFQNRIEFNLLDTYFVVENHYVLIPFFILISFIFYFFKEKTYSFNRKMPFVIFLFFGLSLVAFIPLFEPILSFSNFDNYGHKVPSFWNAGKLLTGIQLIVVVLMLFAAYSYGKSKK